MQKTGEDLMHVELNDWKNSWLGIDIDLDPEEIDPLIELLKMIRDDHEQHFHISSDYKGTGGIGQITLAIKTGQQRDNMSLSGRAMAPGEEIQITGKQDK
jgi:hypothetical protein